jgi:hypothetical protein
MQNGIPYGRLRRFSDFVGELRDRYGWDALARLAPEELAPRTSAHGLRSPRWQRSGLRHVLAEDGDWGRPSLIAGALLRDLARAALGCRNAGLGAADLTDETLSGFGVDLLAPQWRQFRGWRVVTAALFPPPAPARRERAVPSARPAAPQLAWDSELGIVAWLPAQEVALDAADEDDAEVGVAGERVSIGLRIGAPASPEARFVPAGTAMLAQGCLRLDEELYIQRLPQFALGRDTAWEARTDSGAAVHSWRIARLHQGVTWRALTPEAADGAEWWRRGSRCPRLTTRGARVPMVAPYPGWTC